MRAKAKNEMKLVIPSNSANESFARAAVAAFMAQLDPTIEEMTDVKTAVSEAVTNCIVHAYETKNQDNKIVIEGIIEDQIITVKISDFGKGISNIEQAMQPFFTTKDGEERSGMGFTVMKTFMDSLEVYSELNKGTQIVMKKSIAIGDEVVNA